MVSVAKSWFICFYHGLTIVTMFLAFDVETFGKKFSCAYKYKIILPIISEWKSSKKSLPFSLITLE